MWRKLVKTTVYVLIGIGILSSLVLGYQLGELNDNGFLGFVFFAVSSLFTLLSVSMIMIVLEVAENVEAMNGHLYEMKGYLSKMDGLSQSSAQGSAGIRGGSSKMCPKCGEYADADYKTCPHCGSAYNAQSTSVTSSYTRRRTANVSSWNCEKCGFRNVGSRSICSSCGEDKPRVYSS